MEDLEFEIEAETEDEAIEVATAILGLMFDGVEYSD